jgi:hypothetical protein
MLYTWMKYFAQNRLWAVLFVQLDVDVREERISIKKNSNLNVSRTQTEYGQGAMS